MARSIDEWIEENHDKPIPDRVKDRVIRSANNLCGYCGLSVRIGGGEVDHIIALVNGGEHRESNLRYVHKHCHQIKTVEDVKEKARDYRKRKKLYGFGRPRRSFPKIPTPKPIPGRWEPYDFDETTGRYRRTRWIEPSFEIPEGE
jgi:5-methylcytosine-specific restriction protein A